jgi:hypothetical protein
MEPPFLVSATACALGSSRVPAAHDHSVSTYAVLRWEWVQIRPDTR